MKRENDSDGETASTAVPPSHGTAQPSSPTMSQLSWEPTVDDTDDRLLDSAEHADPFEEQLITEMVRLRGGIPSEKVDQDVTPEIAQLREAIAGKVKARTNVYQQWIRYLDNDKEAAEKYAACAGRAAKAEMRKTWAEKELVVHETQLRQKRELTSSQWARGTFMTFRRIWKKEHDKQTAMNICMSCLAKGENFYRFDKDRRQLVFRYVVEGDDEALNQSWTISQTMLPPTSSGASPSQAPPQQLQV